MNERTFSRRRRGGQRFRPPGGLSSNPPRQDSSAQQARQTATQTAGGEEPIFDRSRHEREIQKAEQRASELGTPGPVPAEVETTAAVGEAAAGSAQPGHRDRRDRRSTAFREPDMTIPAEVQEDGAFAPVPVASASDKGFVGVIRQVANKVIKKVQRLIKPEKVVHKEVIINAESLETRVAVLEDGKLEEFTIERTSDERLVGSIYKGRVRNLEDGLKAAFVDIGFEKNAFLHYWDIVPNNFDSSVEIVERESRKRDRDRPRITQRDIPKLYPPGSELIVQVTKGPISTKGPRVTTNLALPGRYLVLLPNSDQCGISRKIEHQEERHRLKKILRELTIPEGMGVIIRTVAEGKRAAYFVRDLALLIDEWKQVQERMKSNPPASCVFQEPDLIERTVRDFLTEDVERIVVDDAKAHERIVSIIARISPRSARGKVKHYTEAQPVFDRFGITRQLENAFSRQVHLKSGGYIVIDETEALVAIDVNTGRHKSGKDQESTILKVNLEAAEDICRQLRLRNMGGLIVLDFIDMKSRRDQQQVYSRMKEGLRRDRAKTHILPISQLGLMEMTRQRQTESVRASVFDDCSYCHGRGKVKSSLSMSVEIQRKLAEILKRRQRDDTDFQLRIVVNPTVLERLRNQDERLLIEMEKRYFGKLSFRADATFHSEQFKIVNVASGEELASVGA